MVVFCFVLEIRKITSAVGSLSVIEPTPETAPARIFKTLPGPNMDPFGFFKTTIPGKKTYYSPTSLYQHEDNFSTCLPCWSHWKRGHVHRVSLELFVDQMRQGHDQSNLRLAVVVSLLGQHKLFDLLVKRSLLAIYGQFTVILSNKRKHISAPGSRR